MWLWALTSAFANPGAFEGTWVFGGSEAEKAAQAETVEAAAQRFNFALRVVARPKIAVACALDESIAISGAPGQVKLVFTGPNPRESEGPSDGTKIDLRGSMVGFKVDGNTLTVDGSNENGGKRSVYQVLEGGTMRATHTVSGKMLGDPPLSWSVTYNKK